MRISIVGAGAIGTTIAVRLAMADHHVSVLARGATLQAIRERGLRLHDLEGTHTARPAASDDPAALGPQDIVFVCTKTTALAEVLPRLGPMLGPDTIVVPAINGIPWWFSDDAGTSGAGAQPERRSLATLDPDGVLARAVPAAQLVGCVVYITAETLAPGVVRANNPHRLIVGEIDHRASPRAQQLAAMLSGAGIATEATASIRDVVWTKVLSNLSSNPLSVLTGATLEQIYGLPSMRPLVKKILGEAMLTAAAYGARLPFDPDTFIARGAGMGAVRTSMLQDYEAGRPLELAAIGDAVLELAARKGIPMETTADIIALARLRSERREQGAAASPPRTE
jgi:2-dehydropantoate 2-reductase